MADGSLHWIGYGIFFVIGAVIIDVIASLLLVLSCNRLNKSMEFIPFAEARDQWLREPFAAVAAAGFKNPPSPAEEDLDRFRQSVVAVIQEASQTAPDAEPSSPPPVSGAGPRVASFKAPKGVGGYWPQGLGGR